MCILLSKYLAEREGKYIVGITCVEGNTKIKNVVTNTFISCKMAGLNIPVAKGSWKSIMGEDISLAGDGYFHEDGIGGNQEQYESLLTDKDRKKIFKEKASQAIILSSKLYAKNLSILALGPLTNLANAYLIDN